MSYTHTPTETRSTCSSKSSPRSCRHCLEVPQVAYRGPRRPGNVSRRLSGGGFVIRTRVRGTCMSVWGCRSLFARLRRRHRFDLPGTHCRRRDSGSAQCSAPCSNSQPPRWRSIRRRERTSRMLRSLQVRPPRPGRDTSARRRSTLRTRPIPASNRPRERRRRSGLTPRRCEGARRSSHPLDLAQVRRDARNSARFRCLARRSAGYTASHRGSRRWPRTPRRGPSFGARGRYTRGLSRRKRVPRTRSYHACCTRRTPVRRTRRGLGRERSRHCRHSLRRDCPRHTGSRSGRYSPRGQHSARIDWRDRMAGTTTGNPRPQGIARTARRVRRRPRLRCSARPRCRRRIARARDATPKSAGTHHPHRAPHQSRVPWDRCSLRRPARMRIQAQSDSYAGSDAAYRHRPASAPHALRSTR